MEKKTEPASLAPGLLQWFEERGTVYPWTGERDTYRVWISETMLVQTVVTAAVGHYQRWLEIFPDLESLARAGEEEVLRAWEGLGYYSRARNLHRAAKQLASSGAEPWPGTPAEWTELPGVGPYLGRAVSSFSRDFPVAAWDANLKRIFQRLLARAQWSGETEREAEALFSLWLEQAPSSSLNGALMQLGQKVCRPGKPLCEGCPLAAACKAQLLGTPEEYPEGRQRPQTLSSRALVLALASGATTDPQLLFWTPLKGRFQGQWLLPQIPWDQDLATFDLPPGTLELKARRHSFTRYQVELLPRLLPRDQVQAWKDRWESSLESDSPVSPGRNIQIQEFPRSQWDRLPVPSVYRKVLSDLFNLGPF